MAPTFAEALAEANRQEEPLQAYTAVLDNIKTLSSPSTMADDLCSFLDAVFASTIGVVATRTVVIGFLDALRALEDHELWIRAGMHLVEAINASSSLSSSLIEASAQARELVASAHEAKEDWELAARTLADIPLDSSARRIDSAGRARVWIRIVRNHLEVDDGAAAETYLNKLKNVMLDVADDELQLHFRLSAARIQDANRQFLAAAQSYHQISTSASLAEEERLHTLAMAIKCAVLAPAGPPRGRVLGRLYKDERAAGLHEHAILENMFLDRLLEPAEVARFAEGLAAHQLATTADGSTVLARAVVEHNLLAVSRLYGNIGLDELGLLLGLDGAKAEDTTAKMIEQGRLAGVVDQIDRIVWFEGGEPERAGRVRGAPREMQRWDANVQSLAENLEHVTDALQAEFPDFVASQVVVT